MKSRKNVSSSNMLSLNSLLILFFLIFILFFSSVNAQPPFQTVESTGSYLIVEVPVIETQYQNQEFEYHAHVYNASDGTYVSNTAVWCVIHIYEPVEGEHIVEANMTPKADNDFDLEYSVEGGNFTTIGQYSGIVTCGVAGVDGYQGWGGFFEWPFYVTTSGRSGISNIALIIILIVTIYAITFISFFGRNVPLTAISGMFMAFFGVWIIQNGLVIYRDTLTNYFGYITIGIGSMLALWAIIEWIGDNF